MIIVFPTNKVVGEVGKFPVESENLSDLCLCRILDSGFVEALEDSPVSWTGAVVEFRLRVEERPEEPVPLLLVRLPELEGSVPAFKDLLKVLREVSDVTDGGGEDGEVLSPALLQLSEDHPLNVLLSDPDPEVVNPWDEKDAGLLLGRLQSCIKYIEDVCGLEEIEEEGWVLLRV